MVQEVLAVLPGTIREIVKKLPPAVLQSLEEIRIRQGRPVEVVAAQKSYFLTPRGEMTTKEEKAVLAQADDCRKLLNLISNHSVYAMEEEMRRGYVTITGGHRVGIAGKVVTERGCVKHIRDVTSFNLRVAREKKGVSKSLLPFLLEKGNVLNTLIISPPQCGKTTLLRDLARVISSGTPLLGGKKVGIVDERSEIAGCVAGVPQKDVGPRTDVLDACPKAEGIMMLIRSMSPEVIVVDEIGRPEDGAALQEALHAGVSVVTSAHGADISDAARRPTLSRIIQEGVFSRYVVLSRRSGPGTIEGVYDDKFKSITRGILPCSS
ncbi:stage III sporulation protein AA [Bacillaceae bacterium]